MLKSAFTYTAPELADVLSINLGTVRRWCKEGLAPIDRHRPFLFLGQDVADFLRARRRPPITLAPGEFLCVRCNGVRLPANGIVELVPRGPTTVDFRGSCAVCGLTMLRRVRISEIEAKLGPARIAHRDEPATMAQSREPHQMSLFEGLPS